MIATPRPQVAESYTLPRFVERRHAGWQERRRQYLCHTEKALAARVSYLHAHRGRVPRWTPGEGLRTTLPSRTP